MRCKPGDLAEVIGGVDGLNVGKFVEVIRLDGFHDQYGPIWYCMSKTSELITEYGGITPDAHFADDWLKPVPMPGPKTKVEDKELEKV